MTGVLLALGLVIALCFSFVVRFGSPYLPTFRRNIDVAFGLLELKKGDTLLDLGSGDGKVLKAAAEKGFYAVGYELNPLLVVFSYINTFKYRKNVRIIWGNYFTKKWPPAGAIFVFLQNPYLNRLDKKLEKAGRDIRLASFAFKIDGKVPAQEREGVFLYLYTRP